MLVKTKTEVLRRKSTTSPIAHFRDRPRVGVSGFPPFSNDYVPGCAILADFRLLAKRRNTSAKYLIMWKEARFKGLVRTVARGNHNLQRERTMCRRAIFISGMMRASIFLKCRSVRVTQRFRRNVRNDPVFCVLAIVGRLFKFWLICPKYQP